MVVAVMLGVAGVVGLGIALIASRWPAIEAPQLAPTTIVEEVEHHPSLLGHLRRHYDPKTETGVALIGATALVVGGAVGVGVVLAMIREHTGFADLDLRFARFGAEHATAWTTRVLKDVSLVFGATTSVIVLAVIVTVAEMVRKPNRMLPAFVVLVLGGQFLLANSIKYLVERTRPDVLRLTSFAGTSFPSGHATAAAASMATFALLLGRGRSRRTKIALAAAAGVIATCVACSRVFLGVHWFTDVLAGVLLGWGWFALCSIVFGGRLLQFGRPVAQAERVADDVATEPTTDEPARP
jgi:undecaprenyl-diphosphatase